MSAGVARTALTPPCEGWSALAERSFSKIDERARRFRDQLGLATDRPVVMTGHQAEWWHCGVLAKFLAVDALCLRTGMSPAWAVPDQDEAAYALLRVPVTTTSGRLRCEVLTMTDPPAPGVTAGGAPAFAPGVSWPNNSEPALESVRSGVDRLLQSLRRHRGAPTAAHQVIAALAELLAPACHPAPVVFATQLADTEVFAAFFDRLRADPRRAADLYNRAVAAHPGAGVAPLVVDGRRVELPLWGLRPDGSRQRIFVADIQPHPSMRLAPRALVLTGLLRSGACDLFVHGTGGAAYDPITEQWLAEWLGVSLAPTVVATADVLLPLPGADVSEADAERTLWGAHGSRHNPALVGDESRQSLKRELLAAVDAAPRRSEQRSKAYRELHKLLAAHRIANSKGIAALAQRADRTRSLLSDRAIARDRTWAFFLHEPAALEALRDHITEACRATHPCGC